MPELYCIPLLQDFRQTAPAAESEQTQLYSCWSWRSSSRATLQAVSPWNVLTSSFHRQRTFTRLCLPPWVPAQCSFLVPLGPAAGPAPALGITACSLPFIQVHRKAGARLQMGNPSKQRNKTFALWTSLYGCLRVCRFFFLQKNQQKQILKTSLP